MNKRFFKHICCVAAFCAILFVPLTFTACSDINGGNAASGGACTVRGTLSVEGALPGALLSRSSMRSAVSSLSDISYALTATKDTETASATNLSGDGTFSLTLPSEGTWTLTGTASALTDENENGIACFTGTTEITVTSGSALDDVVLSLSLDTGVFSSSSGYTGSVSLVIANETSSISTVTVSAKAIDIDSASFTFSDGSATVALPEVPTGSHLVTFIFSDSNGNELYSCTEAVSVFAGFTTDTWVGDSAYISDGVFTITSDLIESYGTEIVPATDTILYSADSSGISYSLSSGDEVCSSLSTSVDSFCFDADGNYYIIAQATEATEDTSATYQVYSNNANLPSDDTWAGTGAITIDRKTSAFYMLVQSTLAKRPNYITSGSPDTYTYALMEDNEAISYEVPAYAIYGDVLYIPKLAVDSDSGGYSITLYTADLSDATAISDSSYTVDLTSTALDGSLELSSPTITDCLYQDGCLYILVRDIETSESSSLYSRGAVVKVNLWNNAVSTLGLTTENLSTSSSEFYGYCVVNYSYMQLYDSATYDESSGGYEVGNPMVFTYNSSSGIDIYAPSDTTATEYFYGPKKFIAVKPKKLIIADDGLAFYTNDDGVFCYKNVNRVVTVDLESFAISKTSAVDCTFESDLSSSVYGSSCDAVNFFSGSSSSAYISNGSSYSSSTSGFFAFGIPVGE